MADDSGRVEHEAQIRSYRDLTVWRRVRAPVKAVYETSRSFPHEETYGLTARMRRAVISVASNIAEGYGRGTHRDYIHCVHAARGSLYEVEAQLTLAHDLGSLSEPAVGPILKGVGDCSQLLSALIRSLESP